MHALGYEYESILPSMRMNWSERVEFIEVIRQRTPAQTERSQESTRPNWRGLQIADELIAACIEWAQSHEYKIVKLGVKAPHRPRSDVIPAVD